MDNRHPHLSKFSAQTGIAAENLLKAYEIEKEFHKRVLAERDKKNRRMMYKEVYDAVHPLYSKKAFNKGEIGINPKRQFVRLFSRELSGRSILDVGCGQGHFLKAVSELLPHKRLAGIDISSQVLPEAQGIEFIQTDVIEFTTDGQFEVVFSDNVLEHIAPADLGDHLASIKRALVSGGTFIAILPNRLFGPCDVTRITDFTYTNRVAAAGTHLNESTYTEIISELGKRGFGEFKTVLPVRKLKNMLPNLRIGTELLVRLENSESLLRLFYRFRALRALAGYFPILIVCKRLD